MIVTKKDVEKIIEEIKTAPRWKIKKWAKPIKELRERALKKIKISKK